VHHLAWREQALDFGEIDDRAGLHCYGALGTSCGSVEDDRPATGSTHAPMDVQKQV
jgi:hypothetical protein